MKKIFKKINQNFEIIMTILLLTIVGTLLCIRLGLF